MVKRLQVSLLIICNNGSKIGYFHDLCCDRKRGPNGTVYQNKYPLVTYDFCCWLVCVQKTKGMCTYGQFCTSVWSLICGYKRQTLHRWWHCQAKEVSNTKKLSKNVIFFPTQPQVVVADCNCGSTKVFGVCEEWCGLSLELELVIKSSALISDLISGNSVGMVSILMGMLGHR